MEGKEGSAGEARSEKLRLLKLTGYLKFICSEMEARLRIGGKWEQGFGVLLQEFNSVVPGLEVRSYEREARVSEGEEQVLELEGEEWEEGEDGGKE